MLVKGLARLTSRFKTERCCCWPRSSELRPLPTVPVAEGGNAKIKHGLSQAVKENSAMLHSRLARRTETIGQAGKLPFLGDKIRPSKQVKIDCAVIGCKIKRPVLKHNPKLHCKIFGCKPGQEPWRPPRQSPQARLLGVGRRDDRRGRP